MGELFLTVFTIGVAWKCAQVSMRLLAVGAMTMIDKVVK
jgi:hypothetical protein